MKKRFLYLTYIALIFCIAVVSFAGCNTEHEAKKAAPKNMAADESEAYTQQASEAATDTISPSEEDKTSKTTLMIYMIGSDLESRSGAGTDDLTELEASGIDLESTNVVVFAGGSPRWHNDIATAEKTNVLLLTKEGFKSVATFDSASMGTSKSLTDFLSYSYKNYPADSYALVMWDHGNGPNIGYGKDMLFDNDSLTLAEMRTALAASPFNGVNKLSWVGFDACLMSSAELCCIWDNYAHYLVASQEIEPAFGWNYDVFKLYGTTDTTTFLSHLTDSYLSACLDYYKKKGYEGRDTTLACMDLSLSDELENNINALFDKATADIDTFYDRIVKQRVATRALGRASTGSEYDLIDIYDMAKNLTDIYPEECDALIKTIDAMVLKNSTNAQLCCGMSMYYPFYNKYYYEKSWAKAYADLGIFASYSNYLGKYEKTWLNDDKLDKYEKSPVPEKVDDGGARSTEVAGTYRLPLSGVQNENYADAKVYILQKSSGELYHQMIVSENVVNNDGVLYATVTGNAIYAKDNYGKRALPRMVEHDTVGNVTRYSVYGSGETYDSDGYTVKDITPFDMQMVLNHDTETPAITAVLPFVADNKSNEITGGKQDEYDLNQFDSIWFPLFSFKYLTRYDNGLILPLDEWLTTSAFASPIFPRENGLSFAYEPLDEGRYYVMFEITDTQGSKYCSELLPIENGEKHEAVTQAPPEEIFIDWTNGNSIVLYENEGVCVTIHKELSTFTDAPNYVFEIVNSNDFKVEVYFDDILINGEYYADYIYASVPANSREKSTLNINNFEPLVQSAYLTHIDTLEGIIRISEYNSKKLVDNQRVTVNIAPAVGFGPLTEYFDEEESIAPTLNALAEKQVLCATDSFKATLLYFGEQGFFSGGRILFENLSDTALKAHVDAVTINGYTYPIAFSETALPAGSKRLFDISDYDLKDKVTTIESLELLLSVVNADNDMLFNPPVVSAWAPVKFKETGKAEEALDTGTLIYDKHGIRVVVNDLIMEKAEYDNSMLPTWYATVENNTDTDISLKLTDIYNQYQYHLEPINCPVKAHTKAKVAFISCEPAISESDITSPPVKLHIFDVWGESLLHYSDELLVFPTEVTQDKTLTINWSTGDKVKIAQAQGIEVFIEKTTNNATSLPAYELVVECDDSASADFKINSVNDCIFVNESFTSRSSRYSPTYFDFLDELFALGAIDKITTITGELSISDASYTSIVESMPVKIILSGEAQIDATTTPYEPISFKPYFDALALTQTLWQTDDFKVSLIGFGKSNINTVNGYLCVENLSSTYQNVELSEFCVNGITISDYSGFTLVPHEKTYRSFNITEDKLKQMDITTIGNLSLYLEAWEGTQKYADTPVAEKWAAVTLAKSGTPEPFVPGENVVFDKQGVKIIVDDFQYELGSYEFSLDSKKEIPIWYVTVINDTDVNIDISNSAYIGVLERIASISQPSIGAHQRTKCKITPKKELEDNYLALRIAIDPSNDDEKFVDENLTYFYTEETPVVVEPYLDAMAEEQILWETEDFCAKLHYFGTNNRFDEQMYISVENFSISPIRFEIPRYAVNNMTVPNYTSFYVDPMDTAIETIKLSDLYLSRYGITSIESLDLYMELTTGLASDPPIAYCWTGVVLSQKGVGNVCTHSDNVVFDKQGVKIVLEGFSHLDDGRPAWDVAITNTTDTNIDFGLYSSGSVYIDNKNLVWISPYRLGPNQHIHAKIHHNKASENPLSLRIAWLDNCHKLCFEDDEIITFYLNDGENFTKTKAPATE